MYAQTDLSLCWAHMSAGTYSLAEAYTSVIENVSIAQIVYNFRSALSCNCLFSDTLKCQFDCVI